jgi:hypothetical protein
MHIHHNPIGRHSHEHTNVNKDELLALITWWVITLPMPTNWQN